MAIMVMVLVMMSPSDWRKKMLETRPTDEYFVLLALIIGIVDER